MEDLRRGESRNRQPQNNIDRMGHKKNDQAPKGFEGMNYEQKRRPYNETGRSQKDWDTDMDNNNKIWKRRNNR